jgi:hypothetical protein
MFGNEFQTRGGADPGFRFSFRQRGGRTGGSCMHANQYNDSFALRVNVVYTSLGNNADGDVNMMTSLLGRKVSTENGTVYTIVGVDSYAHSDKYYTVKLLLLADDGTLHTAGPNAVVVLPAL